MQPPAPSDAELARRISDGREPGAEAEFCGRFAPRIRLFGLKRLRSEAAAADLVQEVLMLVLEKLRSGEVREPDRIGSFVLGTARQLIIDGRRNSRRRERLMDTYAVELQPYADTAGDPPDSGRLQHCLQALPERERSVIVMTFFEDVPAETLGLQFGLTPGNVRVIRHRGLTHLRDCLERSGEKS